MIQQIIVYALDKLIESIKDENDESNNIIRESAKRAKEVINHIELYGVNYIGLTYEQFVEQLKDRPNVYLLSDDQKQSIENIINLLEILDVNGYNIIKQEDKS